MLLHNSNTAYILRFKLSESTRRRLVFVLVENSVPC